MIVTIHFVEHLPTGAPPPPTVLNYYTGGFANAKRLTRGLGWVFLLLSILVS